MDDNIQRVFRAGPAAEFAAGLTMLAMTLAMLVGAVLIVTASSAVAQSGRGRPRVIQLEEIRIEGRVQKPNAFYILNRSSIGYEITELRTSFLKRVVRSVRKAPF